MICNFLMLDKDKEASFIIRCFDGDRVTINFHLGMYETENENIAKGLRGAPEYGKRFIEQGDVVLPEEPKKIELEMPEKFKKPLIEVKVKSKKGNIYGKHGKQKASVY